MALIALFNDLWCGWDGSDAPILALLELSAAFSTINHGSLLGGLRGLGVGYTKLCWFTYSEDWGGEILFSDPSMWEATGVKMMSPLLFNSYMK